MNEEMYLVTTESYSGEEDSTLHVVGVFKTQDDAIAWLTSYEYNQMFEGSLSCWEHGWGETACIHNIPVNPSADKEFYFAVNDEKLPFWNIH